MIKIYHYDIKSALNFVMRGNSWAQVTVDQLHQAGDGTFDPLLHSHEGIDLVLSDRFREAKFQWPLSGNEINEWSGESRPEAVIPANAGIQRRLSKDTGFRVPLRGPGMTVHGREHELPNNRFVEAKLGNPAPHSTAALE